MTLSNPNQFYVELNLKKKVYRRYRIKEQTFIKNRCVQRFLMNQIINLGIVTESQRPSIIKAAPMALEEAGVPEETIMIKNWVKSAILIHGIKI